VRPRCANGVVQNGISRRPSGNFVRAIIASELRQLTARGEKKRRKKNTGRSGAAGAAPDAAAAAAAGTDNYCGQPLPYLLFHDQSFARLLQAIESFFSVSVIREVHAFSSYYVLLFTNFVVSQCENAKQTDLTR
jgi:hypothetical protein